jgi:fructokinase
VSGIVSPNLVPPSIVVVGEALVDLVPNGEGSYLARPGGSPANTAVALARLGTPVALLARLSGDELGRLLRSHLLDNGVDLSHAVAGDEPSSVALVTRGADGSPSYRFWVDGTVDWQWQPGELPALDSDVAAVHAGSLALLRSPVLEDWLSTARAHSTICLDPNLRSGLLPADARKRVERWLGIADIIKLSVEDLALLYDDPADDIARRWRQHGPALIVVTAGAAGATAYFGDTALHRGAPTVDVVDTIGAGDAFSAALLHELAARGVLGGRPLLSSDDVDAALQLAVTAAVWTCTRRGAQPPTKADLAHPLP